MAQNFYFFVILSEKPWIGNMDKSMIYLNIFLQTLQLVNLTYFKLYI